MAVVWTILTGAMWKVASRGTEVVPTLVKLKNEFANLRTGPKCETHIPLRKSLDQSISVLRERRYECDSLLEALASIGT